MKAQYLVILSAFWLGEACALTLPDSPIRSYECLACESLSHESISSAWKIANISDKTQTEHKQESRSFYIKTTLGDLEKGVSVPVLGAGAVIRVTPMHPSLKLGKPQFYIAKNGVKQSIHEASSLLLQNEAVPNTEFTGQNLAMFQLKPDLGAGNFVFGVESAGANAAEPCVIQVLDQGSNTYMSIKTDKAHYRYGDELTATFLLHDDAYGFPIDEIQASLVSPTGETTPLTIERLKWNIYQAKTSLKNETNPEGKNWYIEADVTTTINDDVVKRHVHSAVSYSIPSAAIREINGSKTQNMTFSATVEAATASRYVLQAVFMATNDKGEKITIANVHSAAWLDTGKSQISFSLPAEIANNYKQPYYLASATLVDYGQLKAVYEYNTPVDIQNLR